MNESCEECDYNSSRDVCTNCIRNEEYDDYFTPIPTPFERCYENCKNCLEYLNLDPQKIIDNVIDFYWMYRDLDRPPEGEIVKRLKKERILLFENLNRYLNRLQELYTIIDG